MYISAEYDQKCHDLLLRFEQAEFKRINTLKERMKEFFTVWDQVFIW
jgi:hypothetical protein